MAGLAMISTAFENAVSNAYIFNPLQAWKMRARPCAGETRADQRFPG